METLAVWYSNSDTWNKYDETIYLESSLLTDKLQILTYNVWFEPHFFEERCTEIAKIIETTSADIVNLQEVTPRFLQILEEHTYIRNNYFFSTILQDISSKQIIIPYGIVTLIKRSCCVCPRIYLLSLPSAMNRKILLSLFEINGKKICNINVHLESMASTSRRIEQLAIIFRILDGLNERDFGIRIFCGDFNFGDGVEFAENNFLDTKYIDIGAIYGIKYTMDARNGFDRWRPDRILISGAKKIDDCHIIGSEKIRECYECSARQINCTPSDHFAISATITF